ncbi:MAG: polymerase epsilon subunit [Moraxellaceae bacterium]|jgi:DNA polymerase-3 subunit epsilon|nr:polymerase epsilon subunit [Moraxellaceae bacterium]
MRQVVLDTETTGLDPGQGHRLIEVGCLELVNRRLTGRVFHHYVNPQREIEAEAIAVHGITNESLVDKPVFSAIADEFMDFVRGAELVIHNAPFDIGFLNNEIRLLGRGWPPMTEVCSVLDTLVMARGKHPGQKNNLDALARRYGADQRDRTYHGALLDAEILAEVYLAMTGGQVGLALGSDDSQGEGSQRAEGIRRLAAGRMPLPVIRADAHELERHETRLLALDKSAGGQCLWRQLDLG